MKTWIQYIVICVFSVIAFDAVCYLTGFKEQYFPGIEGRERYPDEYFINDTILGHDIKSNQQAVMFDWIDHNAVIFSNRYGCFDKHEEYDSPVIYVAGDSVSWGYAEYQKKFGYLIEKKLGTTVAKCGVTHSGQKHQLIKLKRWIKQTGIKPEMVLLTWVGNDPVNDFLFPQATVLKRKFVDQAMLGHDRNSLQRKAVPDISRRLQEYQQKKNSDQCFFITSLKRYSISVNIIFKVWQKIGGRSTLSESDKSTMAEANLQDLQELINYANSENIPIVFLTYSFKPNVTDNVYQFLKSKNQYVIDYYSYLEEQNIASENVRWPINGHPNNRGNDIIASLFIELIKENKLLD